MRRAGFGEIAHELIPLIVAVHLVDDGDRVREVLEARERLIAAVQRHRAADDHNVGALADVALVRLDGGPVEAHDEIVRVDRRAVAALQQDTAVADDGATLVTFHHERIGGR